VGCTTVSTNFDAYAPFTPGGALGIPGVSFSGGVTDFGFFSSLTGIVFFSTAPTMRIRLTEVHEGFSFDFAHAFDPIAMDVFRSGSLVSSSTLTGVVPGGFTFPEGNAASGVLFDEIRLSNASGLAIDNFSAACP